MAGAIAVNVDGRVCDPADARVSVFDHGFLYGDSVYETLLAVGTRCFRLDAHLARLERSAAGVGITLPITRRELALGIEATLAAAGNSAAAVRVMITRGEGPVGLDPGLCPRATWVVIVRPYPALDPDAYARGVRAVVARRPRNAARALDPAIKSGNFLNNILAQGEARAAGAFEAILLNPEGSVAEGTQSNLFLARAGELATPPPGAGILLGITRAELLALAAAAGLPCREREVFVPELYEADEVMLTSTLKGVVPVTALGRRPVGDGAPGPLARRLQELLRDAVATDVGAPAPW